MERKHLKIPFSAHVRFGEGHPSRDEGFAPTPNAVDEMHVGFGQLQQSPISITLPVTVVT
jgi:hypothetical protein